MVDLADAELLRRYVADGSEPAFAELVKRHLGLVYFGALRRTGGDHHLAAEVSQSVFTRLAHHARPLQHHSALSAWLFTTTRNAAINARVAEERRRQREQEAFLMQESQKAETSAAEGDHLRPMLYEVLDTLPDRDRAAVLLRFFDGRSFEEMSASLGVTEAAARKRVDRALDRLHRAFSRRGIVSTGAAMAAALSAEAVALPPVALGASIAAGAVVSAGAAGGGAGLLTFIVMNKIKTGVIGAIVIASLATAVVQTRSNRELRTELQALQRPAPAPARQTAPYPLRGAKAVAAPAAAPDGTPAVAKLSIEEIEAKLTEIIRNRLWQQGSTVHQLLDGIESRDMPAAMVILERLATGIARANLRPQFAEQWTKADPAAAAAWSSQLPPGPDQQHLRRLVSNLWAQKDPETALQFAGPSEEGFRRITLRQPENAAARALQLPSGDDRVMAVRIVTQTWFEKDPVGTVRWIEKLEGGDDRVVALAAVMRELVPSDPQAVASYIAHLPPTDRAIEVGRDFAAQWANEDASSAARWAMTLPEGTPLRERAIGVIAELWTRDDAAGAATWITSLPTGGGRDKAARVLVDTMASYDPAGAAALLPKLATDTTRDALAIKIAQSWLKSDPPTAQRWLAQTTLPEAEKQMLLEGRTPSR